MIKEVTIPKKRSAAFERELEQMQRPINYHLFVRYIKEYGTEEGSKRWNDELDDKEEKYAQWLIDNNIIIDDNKQKMSKKEKAILKQLYENMGLFPHFVESMGRQYGNSWGCLLPTSKMLFDE